MLFLADRGYRSIAHEVARYIGRHGTKRVAEAVLIGAVPPQMLKTPANPGGLPMDAFDQMRAGVLTGRSQFFKDLSAPFYGANRLNNKVTQGLRDSFWLQGMQAGFKAVFDCIKAFSGVLVWEVEKWVNQRKVGGAPTCEIIWLPGELFWHGFARAWLLMVTFLETAPWPRHSRNSRPDVFIGFFLRLRWFPQGRVR